MTARAPRPATRVARDVAAVLSTAAVVLLLGACGSTPYAADPGSGRSTPPAGGGSTGSPGQTGGTGGTDGTAGTGGSAGTGATKGTGGPSGTGTAGSLAPPDMPTDPVLPHGPVRDPDAPVSATDLPGATLPLPGVAGRVTDATGAPVAGVAVVVVSRSVPPVPVPELAVLTGPDGRYAWPPLAPGRWDVQVSRGGHTTSVAVTLERGHTVTADLVMP